MRGAVATCFFCFYASAIAPVSGAATTTSTDAVTYQIDVAHSGRASLEGFTGHLSHLWTRDLGGGVSYPVIADGRVFVTVVAGSTTTLYALDPVSGNTVWQAAIPGQDAFSLPAYDNAQIFVLNASGLLEAFSSTTGTKHWATQLPYQWIFTSPPVASGGSIFIGGLGDAGRLYAVNEKTGRITWQTGIHNVGTPVVYGKFVATAAICEQYYGFASRTGEWLWTDESLYSGGGAGVPAYYDNHLFVLDGCAGLFPSRMLNPKTGAFGPTFKSDLPLAFFTIDGTDYMVTTVDRALRAMAVESNIRRWAFNGDGQLSTSPVIVNSYVVQGSESGRLYILNEADGSVVSSFNVGAPIQGPGDGGPSHPLPGIGAANGVLIVPATSKLIAFAPK